MTGRNCDKCDSCLEEDDYTSYGSWSYTCHECGFTYHHGTDLKKQLDDFDEKDDD